MQQLQAHFRSPTCQQLAESLTGRKELWIDGLGIENIEFVSRLPSLEKIDLSDNIVVDLSPLSSCHRLSHLWLSDNEIVSIDALASLNELKVLSLDSNRIVEIESLSSCVKIQALNIDNNLIQRIDALKNLKSLKFLFARRNRITSVWAISFDGLGRSLRKGTQASAERVAKQLDWNLRAEKIGRPGRVYQIKELSENPLAKAPWEGGTVKDRRNCPPDSIYENMRDYCRLDHF